MDIAIFLVALTTLYLVFGSAERSAIHSSDASGTFFLARLLGCLIPVLAVLVLMTSYFNWHAERIDELETAASFNHSNPKVLPNGDLEYLAGFSFGQPGRRATVIHSAYRFPSLNYVLRVSVFTALVVSLAARFYRWLINTRLRRRSEAESCTSCGYDLRGSSSSICSECGCPSDALPAVRRRLRLFLLGAIAVALISWRTNILGVLIASDSIMVFVGSGGIWPSLDPTSAQSAASYWSNFVWEFPYYAIHRLPWVVNSNGPLQYYGVNPTKAVAIPFWLVASLLLSCHLYCWKRPFRRAEVRNKNR